MARTGTPTQITVHDSQGNAVGVFLWSDGSVTTDSAGSKLANSKWQPGGENYSQVTAAAGGTGAGGAGGTGGTPSTGPGSSGIPGIGNYPAATGITVTQPAGDPYGAAARFGGVPGGSLDPLNYRIYTGNMSTAALPPGSTNPGTPAPTPVPQPQPVPAPVPSPSPAPPPGSGGSGAPSPGGGTGGYAGGAGGLPPSGQTPGAGSGSGTGQGGNAGGAQGADRGGFGGMFGGNDRGLAFGNGGGANTQGAASTAGGSPPSWGSTQNYIDLPGWADGLWSLAGMAPGFVGTGIGAAHALARGYQTANTDALNQKLGGEGLDFGQWLAGIAGLNRRGDLSDPLIMDRGEATKAYPGATAGVSAGGVYDPSFLSRLFGGTLQTEYTPDEFADRKAIAGMAPAGAHAADAGGMTMPRPVYDKPIGPTITGAPMAATVAPKVKSNNGMVSPDGVHQIPSAYVGTLQAQQYGYDPGGNYIGGNNPGLSGSNAGTQNNQGAFGRASGANAAIGANVGPGYRDTGTDQAGFAKGGFVGTKLSPQEELLFQRDMMFAPGYRDWARGMGDERNQAINNRNYDTRGAWQAGVVPQVYSHDGRYHWDSVAPADPPRERGKDLKAPDHPTRWMETFMERYGVDPFEAPPAMLSDALKRGIVPNSVGAGNMAGGGAVRGRPDNTMDNRLIHANEGEFVVSNDPAKILGPTVLNWLNNAPHAARARGLLEGVIGKADPKGPGASGEPRSAISAAAAGDLRDLTNQEPLMMGRTVGRETRGMDAATPASIAELRALIGQEGQSMPDFVPAQMPTSPRGAPLPVPMRKPGAPMVLAGRVIPGKGIGAGKLAKAGGKNRPAGPSESDRLNQQMLAMILARRAAQQASAGQGMRFGA